MTSCPCGLNRPFDECCAPIIEGVPASTAEALMRSRYSAFVKRKLDHVERTHAPEVRDDFNRAEAERLAEESELKGLKICSVKETGDTAAIEFSMKIRQDKKEVIKTALSHFRCDRGKWFFVRSEPVKRQQRVSKVGRNDPCPCQSGKKAKKCCGATVELM